MKMKFALVLAAGGFMLMQSCATTPAEPTPVDFTLANVQGTWSIDKITDYDMSDVELSVNNVPDGFYDWTYGTDDSLRVFVSGSEVDASHYQLGSHLGKDIIISTLGAYVDTVEITLLTATTMELNNKIDVTATTAAGNEYEKYNFSR